MTAQAGRVMAYIVAGAILGAAGAGLYGAFDHAVAYRVLQWAGAATLMWIGVSVAGLLPALSALDRRVAGMSAALSSTLARFRRFPVLGPFGAGLGWGTVPCPMVYAALFTAMLTGSAAGGATLMAGFGLGTLPAVTLTAFGVTTLARVETKALARSAIGLAIAVLGFSTVYPASPTAGLLCLTP
jgi:sulfite exporter TauE/SafE